MNHKKHLRLLIIILVTNLTQQFNMNSVINAQTSLNTQSHDYIVIDIPQDQVMNSKEQNNHPHDNNDYYQQPSQEHLVLDTSDLEANVYVNIQKPSMISRLFKIIITN